MVKLAIEVPTRFTLMITLGNIGMNSSENIADALLSVAGRVREGVEPGTISDVNGNTVGYWRIGA